MNVFPDIEVEDKVDESLANQEEGITNQNQGGLEPNGEGNASDGTEPFVPETDADGNPIEDPTEDYDEEVIVYDDGLGLPDTHAGGSEIISAISDGVTKVDTPAPGDAAPGSDPTESKPKETKPDDN